MVLLFSISKSLSRNVGVTFQVPKFAHSDLLHKTPEEGFLGTRRIRYTMMRYSLRSKQIGLGSAMSYKITFWNPVQLPIYKNKLFNYYLFSLHWHIFWCLLNWFVYWGGWRTDEPPRTAELSYYCSQRRDNWQAKGVYSCKSKIWMQKASSSKFGSESPSPVANSVKVSAACFIRRAWRLFTPLIMPLESI